jgi:hypothetical protein
MLRGRYVANIQAVTDGVTVYTPCGASMQSEATTDLVLPHLFQQAREAHIVPSLHSGSLYSVAKLCDDGCIATFTATECKITKNDQLVLRGTRSATDGLWMADNQELPIKTSNSVPAAPAALFAANAMCPEPNIAARIAFFHAALFSPAISMFCATLDVGHLQSFPGKVSATQVRHHLLFSETMHKGHLDQERQGLRSTKIQAVRSAIPPPSNASEFVKLNEIDTALLNDCITPPPIEQRTHAVYLTSIEAICRLYSDPTGRFLVPSVSGNKYIMVAYDYDSKYIFAEPMLNREKGHHIKAYQKILQTPQARGLAPKFHVLDNEVSEALLSFLTAAAIQVQQ